MKTTLTILLFFISLCSSIKAQEYTLKGEINNIEGKFTTDPLGNIYIYNKGDITKFNSDGIEISRFSTREFGDISSVDASNPMKVMVVFSDFSKVMILDASLGKNSSLDLSYPGFQLVKIICSSRESGYWIFDPIDKRLKKITDQLEISGEGTQLRQITEEPLTPLYLFDSGKWLIMSVPEYGFLVFDRFGTYYKTFKSPNKSVFQANGDEILFKENNKMCLINIKSGITQYFILPENDPEDQCRVEGKQIFLMRKNSLKIFSY